MSKCFKSAWFSCVSVLLVAIVAGASASAQVLFTGAQQTLASFSNAQSISPMAVDGLGDAFFVTTDGSTNTLYEMPSNGALTVLNASFGFFPAAVTVDGAGQNLYFVYYGTTPACGGVSYVYLATAAVGAGATAANLPCSFQFSGYTLNYSDPTGMAMDGAGNLYLADFGGGVIYEFNAPVTSASVPAKFMDLYQQPFDIAVTPSGTIDYTALDYSNNSANTLFQVPATGFTTVLPANGVTATVLAAGLPSVQSGLAVDAAGNVFVGGGSSPTVLLSGTTQVPLYSGFPQGVAGIGVDAVGDLFLTGSTANYVPTLARVALSGANLGSKALNAASGLVTLNFSVAAGTTIGSVGVLTGGLAGKDFADAGGSTCKAQTYSAATACVVNVRMTPKLPGVRLGAVVMADSGGNPLATGPLYGTGLGPQVLYQGGANVNVVSTLSGPLGVRVDGAGDVLIADAFHARVLLVTPSGVQLTVGSGFVEPSGLAIDGAGNVFVADLGAGKVFKVTPSGVQKTYLSGLSDPYGLSVDGMGTLYVSEPLSNTVLKITRTGLQTKVGSGLNFPYENALDAAGNLYLGDFGSGNIYKITPAGVQTTFASGFSSPVGVAVDAAGDVYVAGYGVGELYEVTQAGVQSTVATGLQGPYGVALDASGNLFYGDYTAGSAGKIAQGLPPALAFATTPGGAISSDSPKAVTLQNVGNSLLSFAQVSYAPDFAKDGAGDSTACTYATKLAAAGTCALTIDFKPVALGGTATQLVLSEQAKFTTNSLNVTGAPGHVNMTGTETKLVPQVALSASQSGGSLVLSVKVTGSGAVPGGMVTFYAGGVQVGSPVALSSSGKANFTTARPTQKHTYTAVTTGDAVYASAKSNGVVINPTTGTPVVVLAVSPNPAASGASVTFTAQVSSPISGLQATGSVQFTVSNVVVATVPVNGTGAAVYTTGTLGVGTRTTTATYLGDGNYVAATSNVVKEVITP